MSMHVLTLIAIIYKKINYGADNFDNGDQMHTATISYDRNHLLTKIEAQTTSASTIRSTSTTDTTPRMLTSASRKRNAPQESDNVTTTTTPSYEGISQYENNGI